MITEAEQDRIRRIVIKKEASKGDFDFYYGDYDCGRPCTPDGCHGHESKSYGIFSIDYPREGPNFDEPNECVPEDGEFYADAKGDMAFLLMLIDREEKNASEWRNHMEGVSP
jgi:hypothetical protein